MFLTQGERGVIVFIERVIDAAVRGWGRGVPLGLRKGALNGLKIIKKRQKMYYF